MTAGWTRVFQVGAKRGIDVAATLVLLLLLTPLLLVVACCIKFEDGGDVFFRQQRLGWFGVPFKIWKFRSMIMDADRYLAADGTPTRERVTRVGSILRRTSIDELPQLFNILAGEMSLIGPRPTLVSHYARYTPRQRQRLAMRPGVTGLAQVHGRNTLLWSKRIELDIQYIEGFSLWLDLTILWRTIIDVVGATGVVMDRNPGDVDDLGPACSGSDERPR